ncbi:MAG: GspE/PulE family protein [Planctomycetota bacterium]
MGIFTKKEAPAPPKPAPATITTAVSSAASEQKMKEVSQIIRMADNLNDLLLKTAARVREAISADRITIYVVDSVHNCASSRVMDGNEVREISVPISNESIAGYVVKNAKAVNIKDAYDINELQQKYADLLFDRKWDQKTGYHTKHVIALPIMLKGKVQGVVQAINKKGDAADSGFSNADAQMLQEIAENLAPDLYKIKSFEDSQQEIEYHKKLKRITDKIHSAVHIEDVLTTITPDLQALFKTDGVTIYILDKTTNELVARCRVKDDVEEVKVPLDNNSIAGFAGKNNKMVSIIDVYNEAELIKLSAELRFDKRWDERLNKRTKGIIAMPLIFGGAVNGVLELINKKDGLLFSDKDIEVAREIATTLGIAMSRQTKVSGKRSKYDALVSGSLITQAKLDEVLKKAKENNDSPETILVREYNIPAKEIGKCYAQYFRTDYIGFDKERPIPVQLIQDLTLEKLKNELWVPVEKKDDVIIIAMEDPKDIIKRDNIQITIKSADMKFCVSTRDDIINIIDYFYGVNESKTVTSEDVKDILGELKDEIEQASKEEGVKEELKEDDSAIVRLVNQIIEQAYARKASDIHIEPYTETDTVVRFRIDGSLQEIMKIPRHYKNALSSRIKIMCNLDIAERRMPQDGKIKFKNYGKLDIELRVAVLPTVGGNEDIVMRILAAGKPLPLDKIGLSENNYKNFKTIMEKPYGLALVVGPTGSGKTTTLHSALGSVNTPDMKIWTAEDPVEITQYQLRQVQTHPKIGLTFERAMKAFLRCDPDIIMVGEMRDLETTATGVEASLTGHLVLSTLHTNNAPETVTRLLDMGIDPFSFADALLGILAQRLVLTLCKDCKEEYHPAKKEFDLIREAYGNDALFDSKFKYNNEFNLYGPKEGGCPKCNNRGYRGRVGIHELLVQTAQTKAMIHKKPKAADLMELATKEGMVTLKQDGIEKVILGFTTLHEVLSVCIQ